MYIMLVLTYIYPFMNEVQNRNRKLYLYSIYRIENQNRKPKLNLKFKKHIFKF